ncbi:hypothetical protein [Brevibacillus composti]|uniref:Uncharacterized protein n=1 Tax=Brevibacillus composti TaxID=2796470 RepID=A0A7T5EMA0_9BACL|nr:hypothetical protein [Brevibacillus composti]QQE75213.1 hypothetical protein JD108_04590 [Brevibacillus composti]
MAKVNKAFRERYHDMKLYLPGEEYPDDDQQRVQYLVSQGFLKASEKAVPPKSPTLEEFSELSAAEQKKWLATLGIVGDDSNADKREALYRQYLGVDSSTVDDGAANDGVVNTDADLDA